MSLPHESAREPGREPERVEPQRKQTAGFTMVELALATVIMMIAVGGLASSVLSALRLSRANEETARAHDAAREMVERLQDVRFADVFASFNNDPDDDPDGLGSGPGSSFAVNGLDALPEDADGLVGRILFPAVDTGGGALVLREDFVDDKLGMPRDLNADGGVDALDHATDYVLLPVTVRMDWRGTTGTRFLELQLLLVE